LPPGKYLRVDVCDTGCGMDSTLIEKIFDPYFTTKEPEKGTGLGLAVVWSIIEEHKGMINVHSESGVGSSFHVYLPIIEESEDQPILEKENEVLFHGSETVLLVDDDETVLRLTQEIIKELGYTVEAYANAAEAFDIYGKEMNKFDIVVTDMTMPGMTGLEFAKKIFALNPDQPIILCTGFSEFINREKALAIGFVEYFEKPIVPSEIAKVMRSVLDHKKRKD
jgi:CheY-like chemotaxis protein